VWKSGPEDTSVFECLQKIKAHKTYVLKVLFSPVRTLFSHFTLPPSDGVL